VTPSHPVLVVDTDVVSFLFKRDTRAQAYRQHLVGHAPTISFMTLAELDQWVLEHNWGSTRRERLTEHLRSYAVQGWHRELSRWWATVRVSARRAGKPIQAADAWIAATALVLNAPLLTHNPHDFIGIHGLQVITEQKQ
jgi:tRNA(fMet)-specific endonuclease VapC